MDPAIAGLIAALVGGVILFVLLILRLFVAPSQMSQIQRLVEAGNTKQAVKALKSVLAKNEHNLQAHWLLCEAYYREKRYELSIVECKYVVRLGKFSPELPEEKVRRRLAGLFEQFGQTEEAQKEYILLSKIKPENGEYYYKTGELFYRRNMTDKALPFLNMALKYSPSHAGTLLCLGIINYHKGQVKEALDMLGKSLHFNPNLHKAHYYLGLIQRTLGIHDKARTEFQLAQKDPDFKLRALLEGGRVLFLTESLKEAVIELERALKFVNDENEVSIEIRYVLGLCYEKIRDLPRAIEQWEVVDNYRKGYKDVGTKLSLYADLRTDDKLKDFLTASREAFVGLCQKALVGMGFEIQDIIPVNDDAVDFVASQTEGKWRNTKRSACIVKIRRTPEPVGELLLRQAQEELKKYSATRAIIISTAGFAPSATQFALTRPIDLIDRQLLTQTLHKLSV